MINGRTPASHRQEKGRDAAVPALWGWRIEWKRKNIPCKCYDKGISLQKFVENYYENVKLASQLGVVSVLYWEKWRSVYAMTRILFVCHGSTHPNLENAWYCRTLGGCFRKCTVYYFWGLDDNTYLGTIERQRARHDWCALPSLRRCWFSRRRIICCRENRCRKIQRNKIKI